MADANAVQLGPGTIYVAPIGTAEPTSGSATLPSADWRTVGYTESGNTFREQVTKEDIEVAEEFYPIRSAITRIVGAMVFSMAELSRQNLALALNAGANAANDGTSFEPPEPAGMVRVMIAFDAEESGARWLFRKCFQTGSVDIPRQKAPNKALIPVEFALEKPTGLAPFKVFPSADGYL